MIVDAGLDHLTEVGFVRFFCCDITLLSLFQAVYFGKN